MIGLAVVLATVGIADVVGKYRLTVGSIVAVTGAWALGAGWQSLWIAAVTIAVLAFWIDAAKRPGDQPRANAGIAALAIAAVLFVIASPLTVPQRAPLDAWYEKLPIESLNQVALNDAALALGVLAFLTSAANVVVRQALEAVGPQVLDTERTLRGGHLLGPIERWLVFSFAVSGQLAAIGALVAAKGILRFPEVSQDQPNGQRAEYVLIGSFVSWTLALLFVPLL